jgi:hypothetical protein
LIGGSIVCNDENEEKSVRAGFHHEHGDYCQARCQVNGHCIPNQSNGSKETILWCRDHLLGNISKVITPLFTIDVPIAFVAPHKSASLVGGLIPVAVHTLALQINKNIQFDYFSMIRDGITGFT